MSHLEDSSLLSKYQFPRWSSTISRPKSCLPSKDTINDMFKIGIDNRNQLERPDSSSSSSRRIIRHHIRIPTATRLGSPPILNQPSSTPELPSTPDRLCTTSRLFRSTPVRIKSTSLTIPASSTKDEISYQHFPKQTHEKRKKTHERKRRKQQAQTLAEKYAESETWFQLRRSLAELKRLATTQEILVDPSTSFFNCDGHSFTALKQLMAEQKQEEKKTAAIFVSESGQSSSFGSTPSRDLTRSSMTTSRNSFSPSRMTKRSTETYPRFRFDPLIVASKPIHPLLLTSNPAPSLKYIKPPSTASSRFRPNLFTPLTDEKRTQLLISDLSNDDNIPVSSTPSPPMIKIEQEIVPQKIVTSSSTRIRPRPPSSIQLTSTIKLKSPPPRCRSATDIKSSFTPTKHFPRFILIADQEHRIESWYHQYPFILSDDLLTSFQSNPKSSLSAYFIDDLQSSNANIPAKTFLQGKPFHINNDWKKYDLIFISNNIYQEIIIHLQLIINLIESSGKLIQIYQINHDEDLKKQVKNICRQLQQQNL